MVCIHIIPSDILRILIISRLCKIKAAKKSKYKKVKISVHHLILIWNI
jgi:hypothetical protein